MKKNIFRLATLASAVALFALASCQKDQQIVDETMFTATIEQQQSKTTIGFDTDGSGYMQWEAGDKVAIYGTNAETGDPTGPISYTANPDNEDMSQAVLVRTHGEDDPVPEGSDRYAIYPYSIAQDHTDYGTVTLPATQTYNGNSLKAPMWAAATEDNQLSFKNLCGVLVISQLGDVTITSIEVKTTGQSDKIRYICGDFSINATNPNNPTLNYIYGSANLGQTVTLNCGAGVPSNNGSTKFYIYLPAQEYGAYMDITLTLSDGSKSLRRLKPTTNLVIARNNYYSITFPPVHSFSVSETKKVYFSPGNLQYIGSASTPYWKFADHQYDFLGTYQGEAGDPTDRDAFAWGTSGWNSGATYYQPYHFGPSTNWYYYYYNGDLGTTDNPTEADWAWHNAISYTHNGNTTTYDHYTWYVLTADEWQFLCHGTTESSIEYNTPRDPSRYYNGDKIGAATVCGIKGLVLLPDDFCDPNVANGSDPFNRGIGNSFYTQNDYTESQWMNMEKNGVIFLPYSNSGANNTLSSGQTLYQGSYDINYWTSSKGAGYNGQTMYMQGSTFTKYDGRNMKNRYPVRPVRDI